MTAENLLRAGNRVVMYGHPADSRRYSEVDRGKSAIQLAGWMAASDQVFEPDQTTLKAEFE